MVESTKKSMEEGGNSRGKEIMNVSSSSSPPPVICCKSKDAPPDKYYNYPPPLAKYEEVVSNPRLFRETLEKLHATIQTKFMIPIIGGKELDLHQLFVEVTSRGGIEQVIRDRRWKEVTAAFSFPSTATNASFVLRKYYVSLIHHYEQIYFFRAQGWRSRSSDPYHIPSPSPYQSHFEPPTPSSEFLASSTPKRKRTTQEDIRTEVAAHSSSGTPVLGVIDGKFEHGYLVTVTFGTEKLKGILYHAPEQPSGQVTQMSVPVSKEAATASTVRRRRRRRKKCEMKKRDPDHPKPNRSGYNFFFQEQHARLKPLHPGKDREISRMIGELWNNLTEVEKAVYQERGLKDKERYKSEMEEYKERLKCGQVISHAVPLQQRAGEAEVETERTDSKMEVEEGDSIQSHESETSTSESEYSDKDKTAEKDSEMDISIESGNNNGIESRKPMTSIELRNDVDASKVQLGSSSSENPTEPVKKEA